MNIIWTESRIREELRVLDRKTGLCGAELPVEFNNAKCTLGSFSAYNGKAKGFRFSNYYFQNPAFPVEEALDTIRHEYAHYMDFITNGKSGHGTSWKQCCIRVGALPIRLYSEDRANYYRQKHEKELQEVQRMEQLSSGTIIDHPRFGRGVVLEQTGEGTNRILSVAFPDFGEKTLGASWVLSNCKTKKYDKER